MSVALVVVNYNDAASVLKLLDQVQSIDDLDHIVVVDNASTDDSLVLLEPCSSSRVHLVRSKINGGYGSGNNLGLHYAMCEFDAEIAFVCNPDVEVTQRCVARLLAEMHDHGDTAVAAPVPTARRGRSQAIGWHQRSHWVESLTCSALVQRPLRRYTQYSVRELQSVDRLLVDVVPGSLFAIRCRAFAATGGFDERAFLYLEEKMLSFRLRAAGWNAVVVSEAHYVHHESVTMSRAGVGQHLRTQYWLANKELFIREYLKPGWIGNGWLSVMLIWARLEARLLEGLRRVWVLAR